jgi:hypothetical protein
MEVWEIVGATDLTVHPLHDLFKDRFGRLYVVSTGEFLRADLAGAPEAASLGISARSAVIRGGGPGEGRCPPPPYTARAAATSWAAPVT